MNGILVVVYSSEKTTSRAFDIYLMGQRNKAIYEIIILKDHFIRTPYPRSRGGGGPLECQGGIRLVQKFT